MVGKAILANKDKRVIQENREDKEIPAQLGQLAAEVRPVKTAKKALLARAVILARLDKRETVVLLARKAAKVTLVTPGSADEMGVTAVPAVPGPEAIPAPLATRAIPVLPDLKAQVAQVAPLDYPGQKAVRAQLDPAERLECAETREWTATPA